MEWTREQKSAIDCREEKSILLAAAAGSGKTAVLVERIISRIKDRENPLSVSELLVLTFTEAAASEMKRKIMNAIKSELEADPANEHLQRQSILLHSASISTVHSFCNKILKGHIHMTDLPAEFSLADETELNLLLKQAINQALEKYYARLDKLPSFSELCSAYGGVKGDGRLRELLCDLYLFSRSLPYPYEWLKNSVNTYKILCTEKSDRNTLWHAFRKAEEEAYISDILSCYDAILNVLESLPDDHKYAGFYQAEADLVKEVLNRLNDGDPEPTISFKFQTKVKKQNTHPAEEQTADKLRDLAKKAFDDLKEFLSSATSESAELSEKLYLRAKTLKSLMLLTDRIFSRLKKERGLLDFSDLEHGLLKLISDKHHNPTPVALELRKRYSEILLDEYQDTNNIQEEIFRLLSRDGKNIFMVGDLKQSIYKFRNAVPELFANKRKSYSENEAAGKLISLFKNFRSRKEVIGTVNFMFSALMTEALGDIDYNEPEFLVQGADYPEPEHEDDFTTEYYVITNDETPHPSASPTPVSPPGSVGGKRLPPASTAAQGEGFSAPAETEAALIAKRIEEIINSGLLVYNSKNGAKQRAQYRDIVILLRNRSNAALIEAALEERGIPAYSDSGSGYLGSPEVGTVLSFLNIIDNPCQDIPLIAVLRSRIFGFTPDELAEIRFAKQNCYFYDALKAAAESGSQKAADFIKELDRLRGEARTVSIHRLILTIYERFSYTAMVGLMTSPALRRANLRLLLQRAIDFESTKGGGLFGFMNYLENLQAEKKDLTPAKVVSENEDVVRIMTIHKSKGLEFPIVFLADTAHKFNLNDTSRSINFHAEAGISLAAVDAERRISYPSMSASMFKAIQKRELLSEEMRLLYVALTRAKEKLIITSARTRSSSRMASPMYARGKKPLSAHLKRCQSFADWISACLLTHPAAKELRRLYGYDEDIVSTKADFNLTVGIADTADSFAITPTEYNPEISENTLPLEKQHSPAETGFSLRRSCQRQLTDEAEAKNFGEILSYTPPRGGRLPVKITVSELKRRLSEEYEYTPRLLSSKNIYLKKREELSAAEKGTITHFVLQHLNEKEINSQADLQLALDKTEADGVISAAQRSAADTQKLMAFFESELGQRLKASESIHKEYSFYSSVSAGDIFPELEETEAETPVLLQGTIDCFFEEANGKIVLLDYKTDNITADEAEKRAQQYKIQLDCYNRALETIFGKKADESYIYFLNCSKAVKL